MEDLRFNGLYVKGRFGFDGIGNSFYGCISKSEFRSKYQIGDIVKFPNKEYKNTSKIDYKNRLIYSKFKVDNTSKKRKIVDMEITFDDKGKYKSRILNIIYYTEEI